MALNMLYRPTGLAQPGASTTAGAPYPALFGEETAPYLFEPELVGTDVASYYTAALAPQPGYEQILRNIQGILSPEVKRTIAQAAAERGIGIGSYGGGNDETALLRALGLSSLDLSNRGLEQYRQAYSAVPALNTARLFVSPTEREQMMLQWRMQQAEMANQLQRQREAEKAQERLARISQQTAYTTAGWNIGAQERAAEANRAASEKYASSVSGMLANLNARLTGGAEGGTLSAYGTRVEEPEPTAALPSWWNTPSIDTTGSGSTYLGAKPPSYQAEQNILWGYSSPEEYGLQPKYFQPGSESDNLEGYLDYLGYLE